MDSPPRIAQYLMSGMTAKRGNSAVDKVNDPARLDAFELARD